MALRMYLQKALELVEVQADDTLESLRRQVLALMEERDDLQAALERMREERDDFREALYALHSIRENNS